jgi:phage/plasmid-associated DNA primase
VKWQLSWFPDEDKLDLSKTFEQQLDHVNEIIVPVIMESLNKTIFPVTNNVVYSMIHSLHRHRREEYKLKERPPEYIDKQNRRQHSNS